MSLGLVVNHKIPKKVSESQYVADLAGLFERRRISIGDAHVCEQFEILFTTSDGFRSQLFTLCTAISHMSESDLSGEELLDLIARALQADVPDGASLPEALKKNFLSGLDAWNNRSVSGEDEWPPIKKPVASVEQPTVPVHLESGPASAAPIRPAGVRTLQEALELARVRGGDKPLRPEPVAAPAPSTPDTNSTAIDELNTLLAEIEQRMKRLRPQLNGSERSPFEPTSPPALSTAERDAAFLERHPYLCRDRPRPVFESEPITRPALDGPAALQPEAAAPAASQLSSELQLLPRNIVIQDDEPGPPKLIIPDALRFKTYLAIAVLAGIALVGTPISGVIAYRYMHPLYIYDQPKPAATAPATQATDSTDAAKPASKSGAQGKSARSRKAQAARRKPDVAVWPPQPARQ